MQVDLQSIVNIVGQLLLGAFPVSLVLVLSSKLCNFMTSLIFGKRVDL